MKNDYKIVSNEVPVYSKMDRSSKILVVLPYGSIIKIGNSRVQNGRAWFPVLIDIKQKGYILTDVKAVKIRTVTLSDIETKLFQLPATNSPVISVMQKGSKLIIEENIGAFVNVRTKTDEVQRGYIKNTTKIMEGSNESNKIVFNLCFWGILFIILILLILRTNSIHSGNGIVPGNRDSFFFENYADYLLYGPLNIRSPSSSESITVLTQSIKTEPITTSESGRYTLFSFISMIIHLLSFHWIIPIVFIIAGVFFAILLKSFHALFISFLGVFWILLLVTPVSTDVMIDNANQIDLNVSIDGRLLSLPHLSYKKITVLSGYKYVKIASQDNKVLYINKLAFISSGGTLILNTLNTNKYSVEKEYFKSK